MADYINSLQSIKTKDLNSNYKIGKKKKLSKNFIVS